MMPADKIGVDRHLLAGNGVEGKARADFRDTGRTLGDDEEVDHDENEEDDEADDEIAAHDEARETADDVPRRLDTVLALAKGSSGSWRC
jgi:hypothetical protein